MQIKHIKNIHPPTKKFQKITSMCWSNNNRRLAVADIDGMIHLFDENGDRRDKFATKSASGKKGVSKNYMIKGIVFSPDDYRLAVAQSDNIVFVYKLGLEWGDKKSICNRFQQSSSVTCVCWPILHPYELVFGLTDGRIKIGNLKNKKGATLYNTESAVLCITSSPDGHGIISGHADGSIHRFYFKDPEGEVNLMGHVKISQHNSIPIQLTWGENIVVSGQDKRIVFYNGDGMVVHNFDYSALNDEKEFGSMVCSPSGQSVAVGSYNRIRLFNFNIRRNLWEEGEQYNIPNLYTITSIVWKPDGSRVVTGNITGSVDLFDACIKRTKYKGEFEFTYVSPSQVIVKRLSTGTRIVLKSLFGYEILKARVSKDQYLIGNTTRTLLLGDLESCKLSEVPWNSTKTEKFYFDNPKVCLVYNAGEISLIEYGINDIIGSFRTEHINSHLMSVRITYNNYETNDSNQSDANIGMDLEGNKKVAYLIDSHTIRILDLVSSILVAKISHDTKIDWLELNSRGSKLLYRDKQSHLYLFDIKTQQRTTLLTFCSYVQWVPSSDVVVAQNRGDLCVWYSIEAPDRVTIVPIKGEVEDILRSQGCTAVIVDEGNGTVNYDLDEGLIEFGTSMEDKDYETAADILEQLSLTPETEAMWKNLSELVMVDQKYHVAERCFAALRDVSKARFLRKITKLCKEIEDSEEEVGSNMIDPVDHWKVKAQCAILNKDFKYAEQIFLEQGKVKEAMEMYEQIHKFENSINIALAKGVSNAEQKKNKYIDWLIATKQEDKAAKIYENEGKYVQAINLFLQGGFPSKAADVVNNNSLSEGVHEKLFDTIAEALASNGLYEKSGQFFEKRNLNEKAIESYRRGHAYRGAVELARQVFPDIVIKLEEEWGDWLMSQKHIEAAIHHFIEANTYKKAIEAAIEARQWNKAIKILDGLEPDVALQYYEKIAGHFESIEDYEQAKKYYFKCNNQERAMKMYENVNMWDKALEIAESFMSKKELKHLYLGQCKKFENQQRYDEAEKLYIKSDEIDLAINMYKSNRMYEEMIGLVSKYRNVHLQDAHLQIAQELEKRGQFKEAEHHYIQSNDWKNSVNMYRSNDKWNDAIRIAKAHGTANSWKKVAKEWAVTVGGQDGGEAGAKLLNKLNLIEEAINYCLERELWDLAFELSRLNMKSKLPDVHLKYAMVLEDNGRLKEAEDEYINAQAPKEAIEMYIHQYDWKNATRVAETYDPTLTNYILESQAEFAFNEGNMEKAEEIYIQAKKPEKIIEKYKQIHKFEDAKRIAEMYLSPEASRKVNSEWAEYLNDTPKNKNSKQNSYDMYNDNPTLDNDYSLSQEMSSNDPAQPARMYRESGEYSKAIDAYLGFDWNDINPNYLENEWINAVHIAMNHLQHRLPSVVQEVSRRLISLKRYKQAAMINIEAEQYQQGIDIYMQMGLWEEATRIAKNNAPKLLPYVEKNHKQYLMSSKKPEELIKGGNTTAAIEAFAKRGEWEKCLSLAKKEPNPNIIRKYTAMYVRYLANEQGQYVQCLSVLEAYGLPVEDSLLSVYKKIVSHIIWDTTPNINHIQGCRDLLNSLIGEYCQTHNISESSLYPLRISNPNMFLGNDSSSENLNEKEIRDFLSQLSKYRDICHLLTVKSICSRHELKTQYAKICISLLRYCDCIPPDAAFYEAGKTARERGWKSMSFVFFNRYLDLSEAIDEIPEEDKNNDGILPNIKGMAELENTDFQGTDVPYYVPIPREQYLDEQQRDDITNSVLMESVNENIEQVLPTVSCEKCSSDIYAASLICPSCNKHYESCIITGYPIRENERVQCSSCKRESNRSDWNDYMMRENACPCCGNTNLIN